ncbi:MAG: DUF2851 family protein, partial [Chloroflexi bacterium]|nr:DUF2851 family protein [Chloroflexota bacterium]
ILQAVWDGETPAGLQNGGTAPTLCLRHRLKAPLGEVRQLAFLDMVPGEPCRGAAQRFGAEKLGRLLDEAGDERFRHKAERFAIQMKEDTPEQVLYRGIMGALGYTWNRERFEELAQRLPWAVLECLCRGKPYLERVRALQSLLLGTAGLLPTGYGDDSEPGTAYGWERFRVRPPNHPQRRLIGAAHLFARFIEQGLVEGVMRLLSESGSDTERLEASLAVSASGVYSDDGRALIGWGRAREVAVNIVLPFACARAEGTLQPALAEQARSLYIRCPKPGDNEITRRLTALLFGNNSSRVIDSARRQQGLLHLEKSYCAPGWCRACPIGRRTSSGS